MSTHDTIRTNHAGKRAAAFRDGRGETGEATTQVFAPARRGDMDSLIRGFPCLVRKQAPRWTGDAGPWMDWMREGCLSSGEWVTASFVLHVWNWRDNAQDKEFRFDFGRAMNTWDDDHLAAFAAWARSPWYA